MGSFRGRLIAAFIALPASTLAEVCDKIRPDWDGQPATLLDEAVIRFSEPLTLALLAATIAAIWFKTRIGCAVVILLWILNALQAIAGSTLIDDLWEAISEEGCRAHVDLFLGLCAAICIATLISALRPRMASNSGD